MNSIDRSYFVFPLTSADQQIIEQRAKSCEADQGQYHILLDTPSLDRPEQEAQLFYTFADKIAETIDHRTIDVVAQHRADLGRQTSDPVQDPVDHTLIEEGGSEFLGHPVRRAIDNSFVDFVEIVFIP